MEHFKIDCPIIKDKNKKSKTEANLTRVLNTQSGSTSQAGGLNADPMVFSFSVTTTIGYSGDSEWMLDIRATNYACSSKDWLSSFEKPDECSIVMSDDHLYNMKGVDTVHIKMFDEMVRELKKVRYIPQLKRNLIYVGTLEALGFEVSIRDSVLKMTRGSMIILKGVRRNNLYYLKGSKVKGQVATSTNSDNDCIQLWHMRFRHTGEKSLQALAK